MRSQSAPVKPDALAALQSPNGVVSPAIPRMKFRKDTHLADWISANPEVDKWFKRAKAKNADSAKVMASYLYSYCNEHLSKRLQDIQAWVAEVKTQNKSDDLETKRTWGTELETWLLSKKLKKNSRRLTVAAHSQLLLRQSRPH